MNTFTKVTHFCKHLCTLSYKICMSKSFTGDIHLCLQCHFEQKSASKMRLKTASHKMWKIFTKILFKWTFFFYVCHIKRNQLPANVSWVEYWNHETMKNHEVTVFHHSPSRPSAKVTLSANLLQ